MNTVYLHEISPQTAATIGETLAKTGGHGEMLIHPFCSGITKRQCNATIDEIQELDKAMGRTPSSRRALRREQTDYQRRLKRHITTSTQAVGFLLESLSDGIADTWCSQSLAQLASIDKSDRLWVVVPTVWSLPTPLLLTWRETLARMRALGLKSISVAGCYYDLAGGQGCINIAVQEMQDCRLFDRIEIVQEASYCIIPDCP